jgi:hypothetical protein
VKYPKKIMPCNLVYALYDDKFYPAVVCSVNGEGGTVLMSLDDGTCYEKLPGDPNDPILPFMKCADFNNTPTSTQVEHLLEDAEDRKKLATKLKAAIKRFGKIWIRDFPDTTQFVKAPACKTDKQIQNLGQDEAVRIFNANNKEDRAWEFLPLDSWLDGQDGRMLHKS